MPVPVPCLPKQPAHLVIKSSHTSENGDQHSLQNLTSTLPVSPTGPPPSFGTREQWISSLPTWRRSKPRRIWEDDSHSHSPSEQDFYRGLAAAENASVIKGSRAEACIPPLFTLFQSTGPASKPTLVGALDNCADMSYELRDNTKVEKASANLPLESRVSGYASLGFNEQDKGAFTPIFEDDSPGGRSMHDTGSSPMDPVTPFVDFVDRAVATAQYGTYFDHTYHVDPRISGQFAYDYSGEKHEVRSHCYHSQAAAPSIMEMPKEPLPAPAPAPELVTPTATAGYRKLSEPLSEWIATFVWKACTTGTNLPSSIVRPIRDSTKIHATGPPNNLATSVHSLLLSTLLQPSAIFLALWYIVRLPILFDDTGFGVENVKEIRFRATLLGNNARGGVERESLENVAPFRLIVLGCMLANKWLDDHTFSNKTWHTISNVPIQTLNLLESLSLDIFSYNLSISFSDWSDWLAHLMSYHLSLSSPSYPQPISRPSTSPHLIIRLAIEEIIQAPVTCNFTTSRPQPVFLGVEERRKERSQKEQALSTDALEIDLDEDGPLREEYMPRRRVSATGSTRSVDRPCETVFGDGRNSWGANMSIAEGCLPPPAKWSPAGDEPILRESNRAYGRYVAVQPTPAHSLPSYQAPLSYQVPHDVNYAHHWLSNGAYAIAKPPSLVGHIFDFAPPIQHLPPPSAYNPCPLLLPFALSHSRSQSYSHDQDISHSHNHMRSYSQSQFEYRDSDARMTANELAPGLQEVDMWGIRSQYAYPVSAFAPHPSVAYQSSWLRT